MNAPEDMLRKFAARAYSSVHTVFASYLHAAGAIAAGVPGDFVECGVAAGANAAALALAAWRMGNGKRRVHLFDSFTGIPQAGEEDLEFLAAGHPPGLTAHAEDQVRSHFREWGLPDDVFVWHPGMFADAIPRAVALGGPDRINPSVFHGPLTQIAVLRLDGDLYQSTLDALQLLPLVAPGGWVICDDWDLSGARQAMLETVGHGFGPIYFQRHHKETE